MFRTHFSPPPRLGQFSLASPWRIQSRLLLGRKVEDSLSSVQVAQVNPPSKARTHKPPLSAYDLNIKARFWEWTKQASINLRHCADDFTSKSKSTFSQLGCWLNQMTGYEEIETLKRGVVNQEERVNACRQATRSAKQAYNEALIQRADSQREVNDLLQRKMTWTAADVARFTELMPQDHRLQQKEARTKAAVDEAEDMVEKEFSQLMRLILARYHEEQVWSDKIRSASTYGSLVALGLNMLVFISAILVVEPWKRRRLVQTFEDKFSELSIANAKNLQESINLLGDQIEQQEKLLRDSREGNAETKISLMDGSKAKEGPKSISIRGIQLSKRHLQLAVMTSGAFVAGILTSMLITK